MKLSFSSKDRILIVAPHPDDEAIGCGGILALYGDQCDVLILTDGSKGKSKLRPSLCKDELISMRKKETQDAMKLAGVKKVQFLNIPDSELILHRNIVRQFDASMYDYIFIPNDGESHVDHLVANYIFRNMKLKKIIRAKLLGYEVWNPLSHVDAYLDISQVEEKKKNMISCYTSQLESANYLEAAIGLNHYRALTYQGVNSVEAFEQIPCCILDILITYLKIIRKRIRLLRLKLRVTF